MSEWILFLGLQKRERERKCSRPLKPHFTTWSTERESQRNENFKWKKHTKRNRIEFHNSLILSLLKIHCGTTMVCSLALQSTILMTMACYLHNKWVREREKKEISVTIVVIIREVQTLKCSKMMMMMINYVCTVLCCVVVWCVIWTLNEMLIWAAYNLMSEQARKTITLRSHKNVLIENWFLLIRHRRFSHSRESRRTF